MPTKLPVIHSDPEILSGTPVSVGTRVPVQSLFDYLEGGETGSASRTAICWSGLAIVPMCSSRWIATAHREAPTTLVRDLAHASRPA